MCRAQYRLYKIKRVDYIKEIPRQGVFWTTHVDIIVTDNQDPVIFWHDISQEHRKVS